ncbi:replication protein [Pantoea sp. Acro-807]|nr:replication protein [Pantoea sp. Acro-807]
MTLIRPGLRAVETSMADTEEGFTRLANALYEELIGASLTRNQAKVAHAVCRKTCGFNKSMDRIADSQISQLTGLPRQKVNKAKNELIQMGVLIREGTMIGPNKHLSQWQIPGCHREGVAVTKSATALSPKQRHTKDTVTKDNNSASENCVESPDTSSATLYASRPEAAVRTPRGDKWGTEEDLKTARWMFSRVQIVAPHARQPAWPAWSNDIRLLRSALQVTHRDICEVFLWASRDRFWQSNVLSPAKLREKWDTLKIQMNQPDRNRAAPAGQQPAVHWNSQEAWENFI